MKILKRMIWALAAAALPGAVIACEVTLEPDTLHAEDQAYELALETIPAPIAVSKPFAVKLQICRKEGTAYTGRVDVDAVMPAHRHGMNYKPALETGSDGVITGSGFVFHMPGRWQFQVRLSEGDQISRLTADYLLK